MDQFEFEFAIARPTTVGAHFRCGSSASNLDRVGVALAADEAWTRERENLSDFLLLDVDRAASISGDPDVAADDLRGLLGLGESPIPSMVDVLRRLNVLVETLPTSSRSMSAFSCWFDGQAVVLVSASSSGHRRVRFDTAHELAHLILHRGQASGKELEREADQFAGSFLMPAGIFRDRIGSPFDWDAVRLLSSTFGVSQIAVVVRAHELGCIGRKTYAAAMVEAGRRGWFWRDPSEPSATELFRQHSAA